MRFKIVLGLAVAALAGIAVGQGKPPKKPLDSSAPDVLIGSPDVTVVIHEHPTTADMVEVTMARADYPPDLLKKQMETLGQLLNVAPRGLTVAKYQIDPKNPKLSFVKASFATNGILDRAGQKLNIEPILKAFAGAPDPYTVDDLMIVFDGERPGPHTVKSHKSDSLEAIAQSVEAPAEIEYLVHLKTQDPAKITFPAQAPEQSSTKNPSESHSGTSALFYVALGVGAIAVGALVYLALLRGGAKAHR